MIHFKQIQHEHHWMIVPYAKVNTNTGTKIKKKATDVFSASHETIMFISNMPLL